MKINKMQNIQDPPIPDISNLKPLDSAPTLSSNMDNPPIPDISNLKPVSDERQKELEEELDLKLKISSLKAQGVEQVTENEIKKRLDQIDIEFDRIRKEQEKVASTKVKEGPPGIFMHSKSKEEKKLKEKKDYITNELKSLLEEKKKLKKRLEYEFRPISKDENKMIENGFGIFAKGKIKNAEIIEKMGPERATRAYREAIQSKMDIYSKEKLKEQTPETILSFDNIKYGNLEKLKYAKPKDIDKIWNTATSNPKYQHGYFDEKRKILYKESMNFIKEYNKDKEPDQKVDPEKAVNNIMSNLLKVYAQEPNGDFTPEGLKLYAEHLLDQLKLVQQFTNDSYGPLADTEGKTFIGKAINRKKYYNELQNQHGIDNTDQWYESLKSDSKASWLTMRLLQDVLTMPEAKNGIHDIGKALKHKDWQNLVNLGGTDLAKALEINKLTDKLAAGKELTFAEDIAMKAYATLNHYYSKDTQGIGFNVTSGIVDMAPYIATYGGSMGLYDVAKAGALKAFAPMSRSILSKGFSEGTMARVADLMAKNASRVTATAIQTLAMPQMYVKSTLENVRDDVVLSPEMDDVTYELKKNTGDDLFKGALKGYADAFLEFAFEKSGKYLMKAIPGANRAGRYIKSKITGKKFIERNILDGFMKAKGIKNVKELSKYITRHHLGWDGILDEYLEEFFTDFLQRPLAGEKVFDDGFWERQLTTLMIVGAVGAHMKLINVTGSYVIKNNVKFTVEDKDGKKRKIGMPQEMYDDLIEVISNKNIIYNHDEYFAFMKKWQDKMTVDQAELITSLTIKKSREKMANYIELEGPGTAKGPQIENGVENFNPNIIPKEKVGMNLSEEEKKQVLEENKRIEKEYSDLVDNDLIIQDPVSGQYIVPDKEQIGQMLQQVNNTLNNKIEYDEDGNIAKDQNPEVEELINQKEILEKYQDKLKTESTPYNQLSVEDKNARLTKELKSGKKLDGKAKYVSNDVFGVELNDGRSINVSFSPELTEKEQKEVEKKILNNEKIELKLQDSEEFNPDLSIEDKNGLPYLNRIQVFLDGKAIGVVDVTDFKEEKSTTDFEDKIIGEISDRIATDIDNDFLPFEDSELSDKEYKDPLSGLRTKNKRHLKVDVHRSENKITFTSHFLNNKGEQKSKNGKVYDTKKELTDELNIDFESEFNESATGLLDLLIKNNPKAGIIVMSIEYSDNPTDISYGHSFVRIVISGERITFRVDNIDLTKNTENNNSELQDRPTFDAEGVEKHPKTFVNDYHEYLGFYDNWLEKHKLKKRTIYKYNDIFGKIKLPELSILKAIAGPVLNVIKSLDPNVVFVDELFKDASANYDFKTNTIRVSTNQAANFYAYRKPYYGDDYTPEDALKEMFLHESVHAFTALRMALILEPDKNSGEFIKEKDYKKKITEKDKITAHKLNDLYEHLKKNNPELKRFNGMDNVYEMVAHAFSSLSFMEALAETEVPESIYEKSNAFSAIVNWVLKILGIDIENKTAFETILKHVDDFSKGHAEFPVPDQGAIPLELVLYGGFDRDLRIEPEKIENKITEQNKKQVFNNLLDSINNHDWSNISQDKYIQTLYDTIDKTQNLSQQDKGFMKAFIQDNQEKITQKITQKVLKQKGLSKKGEDIKLDELALPDINTLAMSGSQKVDALLNGYAPLWRSIADKLGVERETVEKKFFDLAHIDGVMSKFDSEASYLHFLDVMYGANRITDAIVDVLREASMDNAISIFNFYGNLYLGEQQGLYFNKGVFSLKLLNPSEKYDEFVDRFQDNVTRYKYRQGTTTYSGYDAIRRRLQDHRFRLKKRFNLGNNNDFTWYINQPEEEKERLRREQHNEDLKLLSEVTGIQMNIWNEYFNEKTKETFANKEKNSKELTNYKTYDNLLSNNTWRGKYRRIQSNIATNLGFTLWNKNEKRARLLDEFIESFNKFFLQGDENKGVLSNLYKLSTSIETKNEIGSRGVDIKSDNFNSFVQSSDISDTADNIRSSSVMNHITEYYNSNNEQMKLVFLNGLHNLDVNRFKKGTDNVNMSNDDLWISQLAMFLMGDNTYLHWIGQLGDKPALTFVKVPKVMNPIESEIKDIKKDLPEFDENVKWFLENVINPNQEYFENIYTDKTTDRKKAREDTAIAFVYNFVRNMKATNELFFGVQDQYESLVKMVKRGGSSNSPGWKQNEFVKGGVGHDYRFLMVNDKIDGIEEFDGIEFMSGEYAAKTQISMGSMFSKASEDEHNILDSVKPLTSFKDPKTRRRSLTKVNRLNIESLKVLGGKYKDVYDFMKKHKIDVLSFQSGTKKHELGPDKNKFMAHIWDSKTGKKLRKPVVPKGSIVTRLTKHTYIQQDLRHSPIPKSTKMPTQQLSNVLMLKHGSVVSRLMYQQQLKMIHDIQKDFEKGLLSEVKLDWLKQEVNPNSQSEIAELLDMGMTPYEPALANFMRRMIASKVTRNALELPINRTTAQEIPDVDRLLNGRKMYKGHVLLPDIAANIEGARYEDTAFKGHIDKAIEHVENNKEIYIDLYDANGELMWWEIEGRDGIIPGEPMISTRVPASDLHSHTVARLKFQLPGNFVMLDHESQMASGSDFDGDQRFNQVFFKNKKQNVYFGNTAYGISNQIMRYIMMDYSDPRYHDKISRSIDKDAYNAIIEKYRSKAKYTSFFDLRALNDARSNNIVGVRMKGILTDAVTVYSLISHRNIPFKRTITLPVGKNKSIALTGIVQDHTGLLKSHLDNILNLAFDNAADPKIELMGLNEITSNMWILSLIGNKKFNTTKDADIINHIDNIVSYFTSPIIQSFTKFMRKNIGSIEEKDLAIVKKKLTTEYGKTKADEVIRFYKAANEFPEIRRFYRLTQKASNSVSDYYSDTQLYNNIRINHSKRFTFINVQKLFNEDGYPVTEFAVSTDALSFSENYIYADTFILSEIGKQIQDVLLNKRENEFTKAEFSAIDRGLSIFTALKAAKTNKTKDALNKILVNNLDKLRKIYPNNAFLNTIQKVSRNGEFRVEISPDYGVGRQSIGTEKLNKIREDFDKIYHSKDGLNIANAFMSNALYRWGTTTSPWGGSYYTLFGKQYRIDFSKRVQNELSDWTNDNLTALQKYNAMQWILQNTKMKSLNALAENVDKKDKQERAEMLFRPNTNEEEPKNMLSHDSVSEAMATEDIALQSFVFRHLKKKYPGIVFFTNQKAFLRFVEKWGGKGFDIEPTAIGSAFKNAVYLDPKKAVQSTLFHEYSHIYWDALPFDTKVKKKLRELYSKEYPTLSINDLEEMIILDIGRAGTDLAKVKLKGNAYDKFMQYLKEFWTSVKTFLNIASQKDLVNSLASDIWNNRDNIEPVTTQGESIIKNMAQVEDSSSSINSDKNDYKVHTINGIPIASVTDVINGVNNDKFSAETAAIISANATSILYEDVVKQEFGKRNKKYEREALLKSWGSTTIEVGTTIHRIAETLFKGLSLSDSYIRGSFGTEDPYHILEMTQKIFEGIHDKYLDEYPNGSFLSEHQITSENLMLSGKPDLVFSTGENNELIVFDFKTTKFQLADKDNKPLPKYKTAYGMLRAPFQNVPNSGYTKHMLQLNMYANMLEEKKSKKTGGNYKVKKLIIVPVITDIDHKTEKIIDVRKGNDVNIPHNEKTKSIVSKILELNKIKLQATEKIYPEYRDNLSNRNIWKPIMRDMLKAFHFFNMYTSDIKTISKDEIADIRHSGLVDFVGRLLTPIVYDDKNNKNKNSIGLGYTKDDIMGPDALTAEELFNIVVNNLNRDMYIGSIDEETGEFKPGIKDHLYFEQEVYAKYKPVLNPESAGSIWHRIDIDNDNVLLKDIGHKDMKVGDEIMAIYEIPRPSGIKNTDKYYYTVLDIDEKNKKIKVEDQITKKIIPIDFIDDHSGYYRKYNELPKGEKEPDSDYFRPSYNYEKTVIMEKHWKDNTSFLKKRENQITAASKSSETTAIKRMWTFFEQHKTWNELDKFFKDERNVNNLYENLQIVDRKVLPDFIDLVMNEAVNHAFSKAIQKENATYKDIPNNILPQTLNLYYIFINHENAVWTDFNDKVLIRSMQTPRMMEGQYFPFNLFTSQMQGALRHVAEDTYDLNIALKEIRKEELDYDAIQIRTNDRLYWVRPNEVEAKEYPNEYRFISLIYHYYSEYNVEYKDAVDEGRNPRIKVSQVFALESEFKEMYGNRFGKLMYDKLSPKKYDSVRLEVIEKINKDGTIKYKVEDGRVVIQTLREIKENFASDVLTDDERRLFLGSRNRHRFARVPGSDVTFGGTKTGILNIQIKKAKRVRKQGGDALNSKEAIGSMKKSIPIVGRGETPYASRYYLEAEEKAIISMIKNNHLKPLMAPLDWMLEMYKSNNPAGHELQDIGTYLKDWGFYQLYGIKPNMGVYDWGGETMSDILDFANRINSLNKIGFSIPTQINNFAIGQTMDIMREPGAYFRGVGRLVVNKNEQGNPLKNFLKAKNILTRYALANVTNEALFDQLDKDYKILGMEITSMETLAYTPMEWVEKMNQFTVFVGLMTEEEWNAYNIDGTIKDKSKLEHLTEFRTLELVNRVNDIHGDYGVMNMHPFWVTNTGKAIMPFKKWLPAMVWANLAPYHIDVNLTVRSGVMHAIPLLTRWITYNVTNTKKKQEARQKELQKSIAENTYMSKTFFTNATEYFNVLVEEANFGRIKFKDLSSNDRKNSWTLLSYLMFGLGSSMYMLTRGGDDEYKTIEYKAFLDLFRRYQGDVFYIYTPSNWAYAQENIAPSFGWFVNVLQFYGSLAQWMASNIPIPFAAPQWLQQIAGPTLKQYSNYKEDVPYADKGTPKFLIKSTRIIPHGSALRWLLMKYKIRQRRHQFVDLKALGINENILEKLEIEDFKISKMDYIELSYQWKKTIEIINNAATYLGLGLKDIDPEMYISYNELYKQEKRRNSKIIDALLMIGLQQTFDNDGKLKMGDNEYTWTQIRKMGLIQKNMERAKKYLSRKKIEKEGEESTKELEEILNK